MTDELDEKLENAQNLALKCIFDHRLSARSLSQSSGLSTLRQRRIEQPKKEGLTSVRSVYLEEYVICDFFCNAFILTIFVVLHIL